MECTMSGREPSNTRPYFRVPKYSGVEKLTRSTLKGVSKRALFACKMGVLQAGFSS